jgi:hypothetical protein
MVYARESVANRQSGHIATVLKMAGLMGVSNRYDPKSWNSFSAAESQVIEGKLYQYSQSPS